MKWRQNKKITCGGRYLYLNILYLKIVKIWIFSKEKESTWLILDSKKKKNKLLP